LDNSLSHSLHLTTGDPTTEIVEMTLFALVSFAFSGWMAWTLYGSLREEKPSGWGDYLSTAWIGAGSLSGMVCALRVVLP
jgi:hypothetical protein